MNRQGPRVSVVFVLTWWLIWITWPCRWKGRSNPAPGYRAGIFDSIPRSEVEWSCTEGSLASRLGLSSAILAMVPGSGCWIARPGLVLWASSASCILCTMRLRPQDFGSLQWAYGYCQWAETYLRRKQGGRQGSHWSRAS